MDILAGLPARLFISMEETLAHLVPASSILLSDNVEKALIEAIEFCHGTETREFHVLLVPFPVLTSLKEAFSEIDNLQHRGPDSSYEKRNRWQLLQDCIDLSRTIRVADRVNKILHADRFCK